MSDIIFIFFLLSGIVIWGVIRDRPFKQGGNDAANPGWS